TSATRAAPGHARSPLLLLPVHGASEDCPAVGLHGSQPLSSNALRGSRPAVCSSCQSLKNLLFSQRRHSARSFSRQARLRDYSSVLRPSVASLVSLMVSKQLAKGDENGIDSSGQEENAVFKFSLAIRGGKVRTRPGGSVEVRGLRLALRV